MNINDLVFTGFNRRVAALKRQTGEIVWQWQASNGMAYVSLLLDDGTLIVSVNGYMYGLDAVTGHQLWYNPMTGYGTGVTALVSANGVSSNPLAAAASQQASQSNAST
jgi:outer membrane protein assembly factor BamB